MADVNGSTEEKNLKNEVDSSETNIKAEKTEDKTEIKTEESDEKVDVNGGGDSARNDTKKDDEPVLDLDPETRTKKIKRQIEYYFGDYNLPTDKFLRTQVQENDGWVTLETLLKFRRLAALTKDPAVIVAALEGSEIVQINEDKSALRRNPDKPLPEESEARRKEILQRSVYVKGFPVEGFTIDNALDFFEEYGPADDVVMRFFHDKATKKWIFKGSVFVKYPSKEAAAAFLALEEVKFKDTPLIKMWQEKYIDMKRNERLEHKMLKRKRPDGDDEKGEPEETKGLPKGATLHMTKIPDNLTREPVKEKLEEMGLVVAYIDFNKGDEEGWIRLHEEGTASKVIEQCEGGILKLKEGLEVEVKLLEGEEEKIFLEKAKQDISDRRSKSNKQQRGGRRGGGRGGGRGGRGGGNWMKRRHDKSSSPGEPRSKSVRADDSE